MLKQFNTFYLRYPAWLSGKCLFHKIQQQHLLNPRWIFTTRNCTQTVITSRMFLAYSNVLYFHILYFHIFHVRRICKVLWPTFFREYLSRRVNDRCSNSVHTCVIGNASALNLCKGFIGVYVNHTRFEVCARLFVQLHVTVYCSWCREISIISFALSLTFNYIIFDPNLLPLPSKIRLLNILCTEIRGSTEHCIALIRL